MDDCCVISFTISSIAQKNFIEIKNSSMDPRAEHPECFSNEPVYFNINYHLKTSTETAYLHQNDQRKFIKNHQ